MAGGRARVGVDIGGTFTDFVLELDGRQHSAKVLTTTQAPERGVLEGLGALLQELGLPPDRVGLIIHGTTLATNALIERRGATTAFVTTEGFRDVLEIRGEERYEQYDLTIDMPQPLVPRRLRLVVPERIDARGRIRRPLDEDRAAAVARSLAEKEVGSVAIGFLHSYANPVHEQRFAEILSRVLPDVPVSLSCEVSPEMREYERFSTTCANAFVQPRISAYLEALTKGLAAGGFGCPLLLMQSSGGLTTPETAAKFPVRLIESGPAGGAIFAATVASACGCGDVVSFDMGGTTAKICLIDGYAPQTSRSFEAARVYRFRKGSGIPLRIPVIEMVEIGAGGGSIAHVDALNRIAVGPHSAGSDPGPACYGKGGDGPTVTDADLLTGKIDPLAFAGGRIPLDTASAETAVRTTIADPLGLPTPIAAFGINEMVDENMANAARVHAIESGKDITQRTLIAFGGAAPLHAARVAESLGIDRFIVPRGAGVGSAVGFLRAPIAYEVVRSLYMPLRAFDAQAVNELLSEMAAAARAVVEPASFGQPLHESRTAFMRYTGQGHELSVTVPGGTLTDEHGPLLLAAFEAEYGRQYSRVVPGMAAEALTWAVRVTAAVDADLDVQTQLRPIDMAIAPIRDVFDRHRGAFGEVPVVFRHELEAGHTRPGPLLIVEDETTTVVTGAFEVGTDGRGNIVCSRRIEGSAAS